MEPVYEYTRQQAIEDGLIVDITKTREAHEAGFKIPVALTRSVYSLVEVPKGLEGIQDFAGRLWDVCFLAVTAFKAAKDKRIVPFKVSFLMKPSKPPKTVKLWLVFNEYEGFTIMKPEDY